jgi:hypothetical protein
MFKKIYLLFCRRYGPFCYTKCGNIRFIPIIGKYFIFVVSIEIRMNNQTGLKKKKKKKTGLYAVHDCFKHAGGHDIFLLDLRQVLSYDVSLLNIRLVVNSLIDLV